MQLGRTLGRQGVEKGQSITERQGEVLPQVVDGVPEMEGETFFALLREATDEPRDDAVPDLDAGEPHETKRSTVSATLPGKREANLVSRCGQREDAEGLWHWGAVALAAVSEARRPLRHRRLLPKASGIRPRLPCLTDR